MKKYQKATITKLSFISSAKIASVSIEDYLSVNGRNTNEIKDAVNYDVSYALNS